MYRLRVFAPGPVASINLLAGLLDHGKDRISAIDQFESLHPGFHLRVRQLTFEDSDHVGLSLFAAGDGFFGAKSERRRPRAVERQVGR